MRFDFAHRKQHDYPMPCDTDIVDDGYGGFCTRKNRRENERLEMEHPDGDWTKVEYREHFFWREDRDIPQEPPVDITPTDTRCPRCYSTNVAVRYPTIRCNACGFSEPLIDYPISQDFHALNLF